MEERVGEATNPALLTHSPSFQERERCNVGSPPPTSATDLAVTGDSDSDGEFEFPFVSRDDATATAVADDIFAGGKIRPFYPLFGREVAASPSPAADPPPAGRMPLGRLFLEERNSSIGSTSSSSSAAGEAELEGVPPESYCLWAPGSLASASSSPSRPPRKSGSTGSMARWRRISELVLGRSHSDGKEKFLFLSSPAQPRPQPEKGGAASKNAKAEKTKAKGRRVTEVDTVTAHQVFYGHGAAAKGGATTKRTFLPYRPELVGLFANVNALSRSHHHPF